MPKLLIVDKIGLRVFRGTRPRHTPRACSSARVAAPRAGRTADHVEPSIGASAKGFGNAVVTPAILVWLPHYSHVPTITGE